MARGLLIPILLAVSSKDIRPGSLILPTALHSVELLGGPANKTCDPVLQRSRNRCQTSRGTSLHLTTAVVNSRVKRFCNGRSLRIGVASKLSNRNPLCETIFSKRLMVI